MADNKELFSGVQMIHKNNYTHTTREGYILKEHLSDFPMLEYNGPGTEITNISQGMYRITIDGTQYAFLLHDVLNGSDRIVINNEIDAYLIIAARKRHLFLYKINEGTIIGKYGYELDHTVNDKIDLLVMDGCTRIKEPPVKVDLNHPRKIDFTATYNIRIRDKDANIEDYVFNMRSYLKSMMIDEKHNINIADVIYIEPALNRALFLFKLGRIVFSGYEPFVKINEYSNYAVNVFWYQTKMVKVNSHIRATHFNEITWEQMTNPEYISEGICAGNSEDNQGFFIKVKAEDYEDWSALKAKFNQWYLINNSELDAIRRQEFSDIYGGYDKYKLEHPLITHITPITVEYELTNYEYRQLSLDTYELPTHFNLTYLTINPYEVNHFTTEFLDNLIGVIPKDGIIKSILEQELESGTTEGYQKILRENRIINNLISMHECNGKFRIDFGDELVGVVPYSGVIKSSLLQELESGNADMYADIIRENEILRNLVSINLTGKASIYTISESNIVGVVPKNGHIPTVVEQDKVSGRPEYYDQIIDENYIISNLILTGEYNIKASYFYKHLRLV